MGRAIGKLASRKRTHRSQLCKLPKGFLTLGSLWLWQLLARMTPFLLHLIALRFRPKRLCLCDAWLYAVAAWYLLAVWRCFMPSLCPLNCLLWLLPCRVSFAGKMLYFIGEGYFWVNRWASFNSLSDKQHQRQCWNRNLNSWRANQFTSLCVTRCLVFVRTTDVPKRTHIATDTHFLVLSVFAGRKSYSAVKVPGDS